MPLTSTPLSLPTFPYYGFNFLWMYSAQKGESPAPADERALDFVAKRGFNFVRVPTNYWFWTAALTMRTRTRAFSPTSTATWKR